MTNNDGLALKLKAAAESATKGIWRRTSTEFNGICVGPFSFTKEEVLARAVEKRDAIFISVANPANILALLAERDADKKRIAELEARTLSVKLPENIPCPGAPQTIWLQTNGDDSNESSWPENSNDVSWCWEKMFHNDTLYVRADLAAGIKLEVGE